MKITNAKYHTDALSGTVIGISAAIDGVQMSIPLDPDNRHYQEIMKQVKDGTLTISGTPPV